MPKSSDLKILDAAQLIIDEPETPEEEKAFLNKYLVQVTLPHSNPGNVPVFRRRNGGVTLTLQPHYDDNLKPLYPYGTMPRLLLYWLTREALRSQERTIHLGDSINQFLLDLGLNPDTGGGKRGDSRRLGNQMQRLFRARISLDVDVETAEAIGGGWKNMDVSSGGATWWDPKTPDQNTLFTNWVELGEKFFEAIMHDPVPVDMRALRALKRSPMALDLYAWATYRTFSVTRRGKGGQFVPWRGLMEQLGAEYSDVANFKKKAKSALKKVEAVYPGLNLEDADGGFKILPGRTAVAHARKRK